MAANTQTVADEVRALHKSRCEAHEAVLEPFKQKAREVALAAYAKLRPGEIQTTVHVCCCAQYVMDLRVWFKTQGFTVRNAVLVNDDTCHGCDFSTGVTFTIEMDS